MNRYPLFVAALLGAASLLCACSTNREGAVSTGVGAPAGGVIGQSSKARPLTASTVGRGPLRIYLIGGIHGDEPEGLGAVAEIRRQFAAGPLAEQVTLRVLDDMNPDGTAAGTRASARGVDLNRNWPARNFKPAGGRGPRPLSEPESAAAHADIASFDPHMIVVLHSSGSGPYVNFDGPLGARGLAERFAGAASGAGAGGARWRVEPDMGYPTPGSMGSYFGKDRGVPILTVELKRGRGGKAPGPSLVAGMRAVAGAAELARMPLSRTARSQRADAVPASRARGF